MLKLGHRLGASHWHDAWRMPGGDSGWIGHRMFVAMQMPEKTWANQLGLGFVKESPLWNAYANNGWTLIAIPTYLCLYHTSCLTWSLSLVIVCIICREAFILSFHFSYALERSSIWKAHMRTHSQYLTMSFLRPSNAVAKPCSAAAFWLLVYSLH